MQILTLTLLTLSISFSHLWLYCGSVEETTEYTSASVFGTLLK